MMRFIFEITITEKLEADLIRNFEKRLNILNLKVKG